MSLSYSIWKKVGLYLPLTFSILTCNCQRLTDFDPMKTTLPRILRTGMTQRDVVGREVGGGFMFGNACTPMVDSCQCMAKPIQYCKVK